MALDDIEDVVKYDPNRWEGFQPKKGNPKLRPFVIEVIDYLKEMKVDFILPQVLVQVFSTMAQVKNWGMIYNLELH